STSSLSNGNLHEKNQPLGLTPVVITGGDLVTPPIPKAPRPKPSGLRRCGESDIGSSPSDALWEGSDHDVSTGTVKVEKWLTRIQDYDRELVAGMKSRLRYGEIGRLGAKMETILETRREAPICEVRDLPGVQGSKMEDAVVKLHQKCAAGSREDWKNGQCEACSNDKVSTQLGDQCEDKCPEGQARTSPEGKCEACPEGQKPTINGDSCERKCLKGQVKTGIEAKCEACPQGTQPNAAGGKCEDKCSRGQVRTEWQVRDSSGGQVQLAINTKMTSARDGQAKAGLDGKCEVCPEGKKTKCSW
ncbi:MAG: hypothetical protein Q9181_002334, partial [Wetmoreana brouardii]